MLSVIFFPSIWVGLKLREYSFLEIEGKTVLMSSPVPRAGRSRQASLRGQERELYLLRGRRPVQGHDSSGVERGRKEVEEALRRIQL